MIFTQCIYAKFTPFSTAVFFLPLHIDRSCHVLRSRGSLSLRPEFDALVFSVTFCSVSSWLGDFVLISSDCFVSRPTRKSLNSIPNHRSEVHTNKQVTNMVKISVPTMGC
jgi:hypothetical protein